jgi:hypothetical protein
VAAPIRRNKSRFCAASSTSCWPYLEKTSIIFPQIKAKNGKPHPVKQENMMPINMRILSFLSANR